MNRNDRAIVGLVMVAHAMVHTYELSIPILVAVWLERFETLDLLVVEFGVTEAVLGVVVGLGYALFGLGALPGGVLTDRIGSRRLIVVCLAGMGASFLLLGLAPNVAVIALALAVWGIAASVYHPAGLALISKGVEQRGSGFAYHGMAGNVGIALGPLATALLLEVIDWRTAVGLLAIPAGIAAVFALRADIEEAAAVEDPGVRTDGGADDGTDGDPAGEVGAGEEADREDGTGDLRTDGVTSLPEFVAGTRALFAGSFVLVFLVVIASGLYYRGVLTFLPEILDGFPAFRPVEVAGREVEPGRYAYAGLLTVGIAGQYVGGRLTDRIDPARGLAGGFALLAVLALVFVPAVERGLGTFLVVGTALGVALFLVQPMYQATVAELTPPGTRGLSYGYTYLGVFGVGALGGVVAGGVLTYASPLALFGLLSAIAAVAALIGVVLGRRD